MVSFASFAGQHQQRLSEPPSTLASMIPAISTASLKHVVHQTARSRHHLRRDPNFRMNRLQYPKYVPPITYTSFLHPLPPSFLLNLVVILLICADSAARPLDHFKVPCLSSLLKVYTMGKPEKSKPRHRFLLPHAVSTLSPSLSLL